MKLFVIAEDLERNTKKAQKISSILDHLNEVIPWDSFFLKKGPMSFLRIFNWN